MPTTADERLRAGEAELVYEWRVEQLEKMRDLQGGALIPRQVYELAGGTCDLHVMRDWLLEGCSIGTAFMIMR